LVEGVGDVFVGVFVEVGGVEVYDPFHFVEEEHVGGVKGGWAREERGRVVFALESREVGRVVVEPQQRVVIKVVQVKVAIEDGELAK
jgi:hypothetical protein